MQDVLRHFDDATSESAISIDAEHLVPRGLERTRGDGEMGEQHGPKWPRLDPSIDSKLTPSKALPSLRWMCRTLLM